MAQIRIDRLHKRFADFVAVRDSSLTLDDGKLRRAARPVGLRQDDDAAHARRASSSRPRDRSRSTARTSPTCARASATSRWCSSCSRCTRTWACAATSSSRCATKGSARAEIDSRIETWPRSCASNTCSARASDRCRAATASASRSAAPSCGSRKAFLMDEPLGTLDAEFRELMCIELRKLHDRLRTTTVFVTHDQNEAMALADHIVVMNNGEILQADEPGGIYNFPSCMFVASFIGRPPMNFLPVRRCGACRRCRGVAVRIADRGAARRSRRRVGRARRAPRARARRLAWRRPARRGAPRRVLRLALDRRASQPPAGTLKAMVDKAARPAAGERVAAALRHRTRGAVRCGHRAAAAQRRPRADISRASAMASIELDGIAPFLRRGPARWRT